MAALVLTIGLSIVWVACIALGIWRGGWREIVTLAAILLSAAVVAEWAAPNGRDLADLFGIGAARTTTAIALAYLLGGTIIGGYLGGQVLPRPAPLSRAERGLGGIFGVVNGAVLLAACLRAVRAYAFAPGSGGALATSPVSRFLIEGIGWLLLPALVAAIAGAVVAFALSRRDDTSVRAVSPEYIPAYMPDVYIPDYAPPPPNALAASSIPDDDLPDPVIEWGTEAETPVPPPRMPPGVTSPVAAVSLAPVVKEIDPPPGVALVIPVHPALPRPVPPPVWATLPLPPKTPPVIVPVVTPVTVPLPAAPVAPAALATAIPRPSSPPGMRSPTPALASVPVSSPAPVSAAPQRVVSPSADEPATPRVSALRPSPVPVAPVMPRVRPDLPQSATAVMPTLPAMPQPERSLPPALPVPLPKPDTASPRLRQAYARVATAKQPTSDAPPTNTHPCVTCGFATPTHALFCPNCGARQR